MRFRNFGSGFGILICCFIAQSASAQTGTRLGGVFGEIVDRRSGQLGAALGRSVENAANDFRFGQMKACEAVGAECTVAEKSGCDTLQNSVIPGVLQCSEGRKFRLVREETGEEWSDQRFSSVANLIPNQTQRGVVVVQIANSGAPALMNEQGQIIADGALLGCDGFKSAGEDEIFCLRGGQKFRLRISDLEKAETSILKVEDIADDIGINLCGYALNQLKDTMDLPLREEGVTFDGLGSESAFLKRHTSDHGATCSIPPSKETCTSVLLTETGLNCYHFGTLREKGSKKFAVSKEALVKAAKKYAFDGKEIVTLKDVLVQVRGLPNAGLKVLRPDGLYGALRGVSGTSDEERATQK